MAVYCKGYGNLTASRECLTFEPYQLLISINCAGHFSFHCNMLR